MSIGDGRGALLERSYDPRVEAYSSGGRGHGYFLMKDGAQTKVQLARERLAWLDPAQPCDILGLEGHRLIDLNFS